MRPPISRRTISATRQAAIAGLVAAVALAGAAGAGAQTIEPTAARVAARPAAAVPSASGSVWTDDSGQMFVQATRVPESLMIDGRLDEPIYTLVEPATGLVQNQPRDGAPVSEKTEVWILYDDENLYVTCRCWHEDPETMTLDDMRRNLGNNGDYFSIAFDTFRDRRNTYLFYVTPLGGIRDELTSDERMRNSDWDGVWYAEAGRFEGGWTAEMIIPFKTLRYRPGADEWGVIMRRRIRANGDEHSFLPPMPQAWGPGAITRASAAAALVGIQVPPPSLNLEVNPYAIGGVRTDMQASPLVSNDFTGDMGFDARYGITKSLTVDFTYNTDFAQVEDDEAQVDLTRFSLFFPEKREFFLEGQGIFSFGGRSGRAGPSLEPVMFFSRRIGLHEGQSVPISHGVRLTGRQGPYSLGVLSIDTREDGTLAVPHTNFIVTRVQRAVLRRSAIGAVVTRRSQSLSGPGANTVYGVDGLFSFYQSLNINAYLARTETPLLNSDNTSYRTQLDYNGDRYGLQLERLVVEENFNPEVGFLRRQDFRRNFAEARFSPRPRRDRVIRKFIYQGSLDYITDNTNTLETRNLSGQFAIQMQSSDQFTVNYDRSYELIEEPFRVARGFEIAPGGYDFQNVQASYRVGQQYRLSGTTSVERGGFYGGTKTSASFRGRAKVTLPLAIEPNATFNWVDLPQGRFLDKVISSRLIYSFTPWMYTSALVQYSSASRSVSANVRFRWEYQPGSDIFVVYSEGRDTSPFGRIPLKNRGFIVKMNRLVRF